MKGEPPSQIMMAIRQVRLGKLFVSDAVAATLFHKFRSEEVTLGRSPLEVLSDRELEVFNLLGQGFDTRQVAGALQVSIKTVQAYCARIKQKLKLTTGTELMREAIRWHERQNAY